MTYAVVFSSNTGNTRLLAEQIQKEKGDEKCAYFGEPNLQALEADVLYVGFWTDKGCCDEKAGDFLTKIHNKKVYLFGTAGFGKAESYFEKILKKAEQKIPKYNVIGKGFMCQGKMPYAVRKRYEDILRENPQDERIKMLIENFDMALIHPNEMDFHQLKEWLRSSTLQ